MIEFKVKRSPCGYLSSLQSYTTRLNEWIKAVYIVILDALN